MPRLSRYLCSASSSISLYRSLRKSLEKTSIEFFHQHWVLLFQPEHLTLKRKVMLANFIDKYPQLLKYRQLTLQVGSIYRKSLNEIDSSEIETLKPSTAYSTKLNTAIKTLKKHKASILRFVNVF
ncbi:MAG: hypothetical protein ACTSXK_17465, partial [Promethearchaeota archaeon]